MGGVTSSLTHFTSSLHFITKSHLYHRDTSAEEGKAEVPVIVFSTPSGQWEVTRKKLGVGCQSVVRLGRNQDTGRKVAVKVTTAKPLWTTDSVVTEDNIEAFKKRVQMQLYAGKTLDHPNICKLLEFVTFKEKAFFIFELVEGGQLLDYIIQHPKVKHKQARIWCRQILSVLEHCHKHKIAHRTLCTENILLTKGKDIKVIGFGCCHHYAEEKTTFEGCGRPGWIAPEVISGNGYVGPETDIWGFGVLLYVLLCLKLPFDDATVAELHKKVVKGIFELPSSLSSECKDLISEILVVDPTQRLSLKEIMEHTWINKDFDGPPIYSHPGPKSVRE